MNAIARDLLESTVSRFPENALTPVRKAALQRFSKSGFPTTRDDDWKYTDLRQVIDLSNSRLQDRMIPSPAGSLAATAMKRADEIGDSIDACWMIIDHGVPVLDFPSIQADPDATGVEVSLLSNDQSSAMIVADDPMTSFNAALLHDGLRVTVHPWAALSKPLGFLFVGGACPEGISQARLIIDVERDADVDIVEVHASAGQEAYFTNTVIQLNLSAGSQVDYVRIQDVAETQTQVGKLIAELHRDARMDYASYDFGGLLVRNDLAITIAQPGAAVDLHGLYLAAGNQHIDHHTRIDHTVGPARSREEFRGIVGGKARCVFNGKAIVHAGADGTDAEQSNHNLLLSPGAEIDTRPELEIYADDVRCAHGATIGQLDEAALFYLLARGLGRDEATQLLTRAFIARLLAITPVTAVHACVTRKTERRLKAIVDGEIHEQTSHRTS